MQGRRMSFRRRAAWIAGCLLCCLNTSACYTTGTAGPGPGSGKIRPEIFDQKVVNLTVDYASKTIHVDPESIRIYLQWDEKKKNRLMPVQARWIVEGLKRDHVIYVVPKDGAPDVEFRFPTRYRRRPAFFIDGRNNSIVSGEVRSVPGLSKDKGYMNRKTRYNDGEPFEVIWPYDVIVADKDGKELFRVDPDIVITGHPPCC